MKIPLRSTVPETGIPVLGLGLYQVPSGRTTRRCVEWALDLGYRHFDTARLYANERDLGTALKQSRVPREDVFVTSKLRPEDHGFQEAQRACEASLKRADLDHFDLFLIHWPGGGSRRETWEALVALQRRGLCRAIGVSNYTVRHLTELLAHSDVVPALNQFECHPFLVQSELRAFCTEHGIVNEAYCSLTRGQRIDHPGVLQVARAIGRTPAQVLLRWGVEHGLVVLPRSVHQERIAENARIFDFRLETAHMRALDALDEGLRTAWDPTDVP
jgi:diketogulonate reductase-like aldo/keto reductase